MTLRFSPAPFLTYSAILPIYPAKAATAATVAMATASYNKFNHVAIPNNNVLIIYYGQGYPIS